MIVVQVRRRGVTPATRRFDGAGPVRVGRERDADVVLPSELVSRRHVEILDRPEGVIVIDSSVNGTRVDGVLTRSGRRQAGHSCVLEIGPFTLDVSRVRGDATPAPGARRAETAAALPGRVDRDHTGDAKGPVDADQRRELRRRLIAQLDLVHLDVQRVDVELLRPRVQAALERLCADAPDRAQLIPELLDEVLGLGPLQPLLADPAVSEVMVVDPLTIYVERHGRVELTPHRFTDDDSVRAVLERIVTPLGRRIDASVPYLDARLPDGSRVHAIIPPLAVRGPCITIRKFPTGRLTYADLVGGGTLSGAMATFLGRCVRARKNIVIAGGTGSGKTTLLNVLSSSIPDTERIITIEDAAELRLPQDHVVSLETRPANLEGRGQCTIRDLLRNALRMRPDRIIVGECRGAETLDMLQAMNTGHDGSMTTTHASSPREAVGRLEMLCVLSGVDLPIAAIRQQIASSVDVLVQQQRLADGSRRITSIAEVLPPDDDGRVGVEEIYTFRRRRGAADEAPEHGFLSTGHLATFAHELDDDGPVGGEAAP